MNRIDYDAFTTRLLEGLEADDRILGLVALGSMAAVDYVPDEFSDHDFFVVTVGGAQEAYRGERSWLPDSDRLVLHFRETAHGVKALYESGHLVEFAVFDLAELQLARVNRYRVLFDRGGVAAEMAEVAAATELQTPPSDEFLFGQFVTNLVVGVGRHRRGEALSGASFVKCDATRHLLLLLARHLPPDPRLDNLDPLRRFELVYPDIGREIQLAMNEDTPLAAARLLDVAEHTLGSLASFPSKAFECLKAQLRRSPNTS